MGTLNVLEAARQAGVSRTVYTSTVGTVGLPKGGLGDEATPLNPRSLHGHYKKSKLQAEQAALARELARLGPTWAIGGTEA